MKSIAILGSTGSIGKSLIKIIKKDKKSFDIKLLTARKNYKELLKQAKLFNVKNVILTNDKIFNSKKNIFKKYKINIYNNYNNFNKIFNKKIDYVMSSIVGIDGLMPTIMIIKHTKKIAIANKESIICGWNLIKKQMDKHKTKFIPVDSEHFSIWHALNQNLNSNNVKKIYLTASGGPLLNISKNKFNNLKIKQVIKHPNWKMGKKISIDSSNLMNKVFEVIEAKKIFNIDYNQLDILIHQDSYVHAIIEFKNNINSIVAHNTTMDIPIFNTLYNNKIFKEKNNNYALDLKKLNNLSLRKVDLNKFPLVTLLSLLPKKDSLYETVLVSANDCLVNLYLNKKIKYTDIYSKLLRVINLKEMKLLKRIYPKKISDIYKIDNYVRSKIHTLSV
tara:strand:- start:4448 stop:5617 length:1170 start_codon:yes stop_codon:yes gene_type:complete